MAMSTATSVRSSSAPTTTRNVSSTPTRQTTSSQNTNGSAAPTDSFTPSQTSDLGFLQQMKSQALALKADPKAVAVRGAETSHAAAATNWNSLMDATSQLSQTDQQAAGKHIFYNLASSSQEFKNPDGTVMTPAQVGTHFTTLDEKTRQTLNQQVRDYGQNNSEIFDMSVASGYADWAMESVNNMATRSQNGGTVTNEELQRAQSIFQNGNGYVSNRGEYIGHIYDLHQMGSGDQAQQLSARLDGQ